MPDIRTDETIAAIATPVGEGGMSVLRVSGPGSFEVVGKIFHSTPHPNTLPVKGRRKAARRASLARGRGEGLEKFPSHTIHLGEIRDEKGNAVDQVLVSLFRAPHSYTGEDVIEVSSHGGILVARRILDLLIQQGARHAEPGEFTKRAFMNGKIDLVQAEAVLDLIQAKSERSLESAVSQLTGSLSQKLKVLKDSLMKMLAHMEARLDFPDEHLEVFTNKEFEAQFLHAEKEIRELLSTFKRGSILREGLTVVIAGKPNTGKSSLFNALLARDRALVSEFPGTTRDVLEEAIEIDGIYLRLFDTAGLVPAAGHPLDQMSMDRTRRALREAQLYLYIVDGSAALDENDRRVFRELDRSRPVLVLVNKCDLPLRLDLQELKHVTEKEPLRISAKTQKEFDELHRKIADIILEGGIEKEGEQITRLRHKNALEESLAALLRAREAFVGQMPLEFVSVDLKAALDAIRELVGEIYSEELLDVIFAEFCVGK